MPGTTDTVKAMLTPGEFVIRKEAVDMIGVPILEKLNDMPEAGGHSEIDRLIAMATLKNMTGMYGGGMVNAKQYMGGGMVNEYQDGGSVSDATATNLMNMLYEQSLPTQSNYGSLQDQDRIDMVNQAIIDSATGTGSIRNIAKSALSKSAMPNLKEFISGLFKKSYKGKIAPNAEIPEKLRGKSLYRYPDGSFDYLGYKGKYSPTEEIPESLLKKRRIQYDDGSFDIDPLDVSGYKHGGKVHKNLKPIPKDNPGLAKLPEDVRNKMGYMQDGGSVSNMQLRREEPINFLEQLSYYEPPMAGEMGSQPKRNFFGEIQEGQTYGRDILRPHEEKYLNHYNAEYIRAKNNLIGFLPEDRELMFEFLNRSGVYDTPGEESIFKNNPNFKVPENEKKLARKLIRLEEKIDERRNDLEKRIRVDSSSKIPSQLDKYPRNLLSEEERKELFEIREQIQNSKSYQAMEDDQSRLYGNRQRREIQKELGLEPKEEYISLFGFDPNRDRTSLGEDPREYEGEAPNMYDLLERDRKNFYSQYQKPRTGLLNLLGFMKGGMAEKEKKYGYQDGGSVNSMYNLNELKKLMPMKASNLMGTFDEDQAEVVRKIISGLDISDKERSMLTPKMEKPMGIPTEVQSELLRRIISGDSLSTEEQQNFTPRMSPLGMQEGGAVQDDAMMLQYLQSLQAQQANPFVPFDQRPPSSGEMMSPIPSGMEQGDMMRIIRDEREVLNMQDAELLRQKAQNALMRFKLDSIINAEGLQPERLDSLPADTSGFIPSSPMFRDRGMGI